MEQNQAAVGPMDLEFYQKRALNTAVFERNDYPLVALGDVLWQWAVLAKVLGFGSHEIAWANLDKLADRQKRDVLNGEGDNR